MAKDNMNEENENIFRDCVVSEIQNRIRDELCKDINVGRISFDQNGKISNPKSNQNKTDFEEIKPVSGTKKKRLRYIILILESPHIKEYQTETPRPAAGLTGTNIRELFNEALCKIKESGKFKLLIMNAIQYQCSLGVPTDSFRDEVFKRVWDKFGGVDFVKRLNSTYKKGDIVINACTKGKHKPYLRDLVDDAINRVLPPDTTYYSVYHPSAWGKKKRSR